MLYRVVTFCGHFLFRLLGLEIIGAENIPNNGNVILVANHNSNWDPVLLAFSITRPICFMAKHNLFKYSWSAGLFSMLNAFPVERDKFDRSAIRKALTILKEDKVLGIFPEGERKAVNSEISPKNGAALLAIKSNSPIIPIACIGTSRILPMGWFRSLKIRIGTPIYNDIIRSGKVSSESLDILSKHIANEIQELIDIEAGIK